MTKITHEQVAAMAKGIDAKGQQIMCSAARHAGWSPEKMAEMYAKACILGGRDPVVTMAEMAYDL